MKKIILLLAILLCAFSGFLTAQTLKKNVAVYITGVDGAYKKVIGSKIVTGVTRSDEYVAVERTSDFLAELTKEQDYQMSGAVSDTQIAKIGQQFGVEYVLIADVSELFGSLFISARMVDVQTAQITASIEASREVNDLEGLSKIADDIVVGIIDVSTMFTEDDLQVLGPYSTVASLRSIKVPRKYRIATKDEVDVIIRKYDLIGKNISFPIYTDIYYTEEEKTQNFTSNYYSRLTGRLISTSNFKRQYMLCTITCTIIKSKSENSMLTLSYGVDEGYGVDYIVPIRYHDNLKIVSNVEDMSSDIPHIEAGYVYVIKKK